MITYGYLRPVYTIALLIALCLVSMPVYAKYSGGTGEPNDPYQIATAEDLMLLGETPEDYDKHFILTADIDLDPNLPGRKVFDKAVIAPDKYPGIGFQGTRFNGVFNGKNHTISNLVIMGEEYLGLFGLLGSRAIIQNMGLEDVDVNGTNRVGGLAGANAGHIFASYSTGTVKGGGWAIGGLVGDHNGRITGSFYSGTVSGDDCVGGLVGTNWDRIAMSFSTGTVSGNYGVGGLAGENFGSGDFGSYARITTSYSCCTVNGTSNYVGGLVGINTSRIALSHSVGKVSGPDESTGGLVGKAPGRGRQYDPSWRGKTVASFWDIETSSQTISAGGTGLTTAEMQDVNIFLNVGWDFVSEIQNGTCDYWQISSDGYPELRFPAMPEGLGTAEQPYLIRNALDLGKVWFGPMAHYRLEASIDLSDVTWSMPVVPRFDGTFDGNDFIISDFHIEGDRMVGLFGLLGDRGQISNLGLEAVDVNGTDDYVGGLVGLNYGTITSSYSTGLVIGNRNYVGGLVGWHRGIISNCSSSANVSNPVSGFRLGGLVGSNGGKIAASYSDGSIAGFSSIGGLTGSNNGNIVSSYSIGTVEGTNQTGGLVGVNWGSIVTSYSAGLVSANENVGGLVGDGDPLNVQNSIWDVNTSGLFKSTGGVGLTSNEMMDQYMLGLNGFAFDPNWILDDGRDYPRLTWEGIPGQIIQEPDIYWLEGDGIEEYPYRIGTADQLMLLSEARILWDKSFVLIADIDLDPNLAGRKIFTQALIPNFSGVFNGDGHTISNMMIEGSNYLGLFGRLLDGAKITNLGLLDVNVTGSGDLIGGLVGNNGWGDVINCYSDGVVSGNSYIGGLVGSNGGNITMSYSNGAVIGIETVGGLAGYGSNIASCYSTSEVIGEIFVGGLVGSGGDINNSYSSGTVTGNEYVGGLVGRNDEGSITDSFNSGKINGNRVVGGLVGINGGLYGGNEDAILTNCFNTGIVNGDNLVGGLVGYNRDGSITMSYSTGPVTGYNQVGGLVGQNYEGIITDSSSNSNVTGNGHVGGLVGVNGDVDYWKGGIVTNSYSTGNVVACGDNAGGLVGYNGWEGSITASYNTGGISGNGFVGGIAGINWGDIKESYNTGMVSGNESVGGLVGYNYIRITNSYNTGKVSANVRAGGLVGYNFSGVVTISFWDIETSGQELSDGGTRKTTAQMQTAATFLEAGWDFVDEIQNGTEDIWWIDEGQDYPRLWWELINKN